MIYEDEKKIMPGMDVFQSGLSENSFDYKQGKTLSDNTRQFFQHFIGGCYYPCAR